jgi:hypothetical protein
MWKISIKEIVQRKLKMVINYTNQKYVQYCVRVCSRSIFSKLKEPSSFKMQIPGFQRLNTKTLLIHIHGRLLEIIGIKKRHPVVATGLSL